MALESFTVTLPSNASFNFFPANETGNYKTLLQKNLSLASSEGWTVALTELSFPKTWYNVNRDLEIGFDIKGSVTFSDQTIVKAGYYPDGATLINYINSVLATQSQFKRIPKLTFDPITNGVTFEAGLTTEDDNIYLYFVKELRDILGVNEQELQLRAPIHIEAPNSPNLAKFTTKSPINLNASYSGVYVYTDIVMPSIVGDSYTKLLRIVPIPEEKPHGCQVTVHFDNPRHIPLYKGEFDSIEIDLKTDTGETIAFEFGRAIATLEFKKNNVQQSLY